MELAPVAKKDLKPLAELLAASCPRLGFVGPALLQEQTLDDPDYDSSFVVQGLESRKPVALALGVARLRDNRKTGYLKAFCVHPRHRGKRLGHELFSELERRFQKREAREIRVGDCPAPYLISGIDCLDTPTVCFLLKRGYERLGEAVDMKADLARVDLTLSAGEAALAKEARVRRAKAEDWPAVEAFLKSAFPAWVYEAKMGLKRGLLMVAERKGKVVAFAAAGATQPGWFGPMGTAPEERGRGLGRILMLKCLEFLKKGGAKGAVIPWVGPIPFYARHAAASLGPVNWQFLKRV